mmetsp:Transcript_603/g.1624  ORF Transcript_603/g.1624 Transcript_603/m.1624 type:complete len:87 (+) Transcript_603:161-421(+)
MVNADFESVTLHGTSGHRENAVTWNITLQPRQEMLRRSAPSQSSAWGGERLGEPCGDSAASALDAAAALGLGWMASPPPSIGSTGP